jgi:hypoxanthine phosphoribosyltransferase
MRVNPEPLISAEAIQRRTRALASEIARHPEEQDLVMIAVLKGAVVFASDLVRHFGFSVPMDFIRAQSYAGCESNGLVELSLLPETPLRGRRVLLVEDILDTGRTSAALLDWIRAQEPASVQLCVLLDKPSRRAVDIQADFVGFTIDDQFVVGYGLDYNEAFRNLPAVHVLETE